MFLRHRWTYSLVWTLLAFVGLFAYLTWPNKGNSDAARSLVEGCYRTSDDPRLGCGRKMRRSFVDTGRPVSWKIRSEKQAFLNARYEFFVDVQYENRRTVDRLLVNSMPTKAGGYLTSVVEFESN